MSHVRTPEMIRFAPRRALTLPEVVVVILAVTILLTLAIPTILSMRASSRRTTCEYRLVQIGVAMAEYQLANRHYPAGTIDSKTPIQNVAEGYHHNWIIALLADLDQQALADQVDPDASVYAAANAVPRETPLPIVRCPSAASNSLPTTSNYAAIYSSLELPIDEQNDGMFFQNRGVTSEEITDGLEYTLFVGEKLSDPQQDLGWISGTRSTIRNVDHPLGIGPQGNPDSVDASSPQDPLWVGGLASRHAGGVNLLLGSGRVRFFATGGDQAVLQQMARRSSEPPSDDGNEGVN
ncbi:hypothetical protein Poly24_48270 [Rosistilla carotiformis]|uniref:DUF1559 domain-containing protein n=1 Tax=Rosistilla carotiformis TaxID=2528017 RepID=A0A518JZX3_9BACT|nr:DUF1559 domain-containing protein [Rosistilla carotiformis]QDV71094.1 hypothetical protein Poly24_48270 [Rosistilla carotiformis]